MVTPYPKKDFRSHNVPGKTYRGEGGIDISSYKLCQLIAKLHNWDTERSYRVPGVVYEGKKAAVFDLTRAEVIER